VNIGMSRIAGGLLVGMQETEANDPAVACDAGTTMSICNGGCSPTCRAGTYAVVFRSMK
jgi:hypothetical protein